MGGVQLGTRHPACPADRHGETDDCLRQPATGVETPYLAPVSSIMGEILFIALESNKHSPMETRTVAETVVRRRLLAVPGVSQVIATGGGQKQYQVLAMRNGCAATTSR